MTRPSYLSSTALQAGTAVASLAITKPTGVVAGKVWVIFVTSTTAKAWTIPTGFSRLGTASSQADAFYRYCDGSEGASVTVAYTTTTGNMRGGSVAYSDCDPTTPIGAVSIINQPAAGTSNPVPGITVPNANCLLVSLAQRIGSTAVLTPPGTMTAEFQLATNAAWAGADEVPAAGATGTRTWTWVGTSVTPAILVALNGTTAAVTEYVGTLPM